MSEIKYPRIGIGVMIQNEKGEVLLSQRKSSHGTGEWCFPGGHLEMGETLNECAAREVKEETDLDVSKFELISVADEMRYLESDGKHYVNIGIKVFYDGGEPKNTEPHKHEDWQWFPLDNLPVPLFQGTELAINNYKKGKIY
jgi:8-oxo-dGTP diphosphatase